MAQFHISKDPPKQPTVALAYDPLNEMERNTMAGSRAVLEAIRQLMAPPANPIRKITRFSPDRMSRFDLKEKQVRYGKKGSKK